MDIDAKIVWQALVRLLNHYPECGHNQKTLVKLAEDYWEDFQAEGIATVEQLKPSISLVRRKAKFFPKSSEIIAAYNELKAKGRVKDPRRMIEQTTSMHDPTPDEVERNKKFISICMDVVARRITPDEGEEMQKKLIEENQTFK